MPVLERILILSALYALFTWAPTTCYQIPDVLVEVLTPRGLRVSIPDEEGVALLSFHGQINKPLNEREEAIFSKKVRSPKDGRWTFQDKTARLKIEDTLYYWIRVDYVEGDETTSYFKDNQTFVVTELIYDENFISTTSTSPRSTTGTTTERTTTTTQPTAVTVITTTTTTDSPGCNETPTTVNGKLSCQGELIFEEYFEELSERKWRPTIKFSGEPDFEFVAYDNDKENLFLEDNLLHIKPSLLEDKYGDGFVTRSEGLDLGENCTGIVGSFECVMKPRGWLVLPPVLSAQISTKYRFSFVYGAVEIRAKLPKGDWIYPELYLKSRSDDYGHHYDSGLLRIAFLPGNSDMSNKLSGGCVLGQSLAARHYGLRAIFSEKNWNNDFHVFRLEWKMDSITVLVDNQVYGNIYPPSGGFAANEVELELDPNVAQRWKKGSELAPFDKEMYLVLGVGVGGHCFTDTKSGEKPWDNSDPKAQLNFYRNQDVWSKTWSDNSALVVDYVKVWAL